MICHLKPYLSYRHLKEFKLNLKFRLFEYAIFNMLHMYTYIFQFKFDLFY